MGIYYYGYALFGNWYTTTALSDLESEIRYTGDILRDVE